jgi:D-beta-D-heptose 7-phosphate kinase/D-beta-D-heptose 1-phosphate adenosyltransferase
VESIAPGQIVAPITVGRAFARKLKDEGSCPLIVTSGAFDPLHLGHLKCIHGSALLKGDTGLFAVIVNDDNFLVRKKGYVFMPLEERMELIASIRGVDYVCAANSPPGDDTVNDALRQIRPNVFTKGGITRAKAGDIPEYETCQEIGCTVVFGIGGATKVQSSSDLVKRLEMKGKPTY